MKTPIEFANEILSDKEPYALKIAKELRQVVGDRVLLDQAAQCLEDDCTYLCKVAKSIHEWAKGEAEESFRAPVPAAEKSSAVGDAAKLREALTRIRDGIIGEVKLSSAQIVNIADAALAAPRLNCEVGTAKEQSARFVAFCSSHSDGGVICRKDCPLRQGHDTGGLYCEFAWGQLPYAEGGAAKDSEGDVKPEAEEAPCLLPCPKCGKATAWIVHPTFDGGAKVACSECHYDPQAETWDETDVGAAIKWNNLKREGGAK